MLNTRVSGTMDVQMEKNTKLENISVKRKQDTVSSNQGEVQKKQKDFKLDTEMRSLMDAETVSNVQDVQQSIIDRKVEIRNSDISENKKQKSLEHLQNIQNMAAQKIRSLRYEVALQKRIEEAHKNGDQSALAQLEEQYNRERGARKSEEYTQLQNNQPERKYQFYNQASQAVDIIAQMEGMGNFVDLISAAY